MKIAIYDPYWDTLGGGERYSASFAKIAISIGNRVFIEWKDKNLLNTLEERFGIKTDQIEIVESINKGEGYDLCFWISDGSIPLLHARRNWLHFQVPFTEVNGRSLINRMKFFRIEKIICNSQFTKKIIDEEYGVNSIVVYPPVDTTRIKPRRKENIILSVGRFSQLLQSKRQDVLVDVFIKMQNNVLKDWKLVFVGGTDVGGYDYLQKLRAKARSYPVEFYSNLAYKNLLELYGKSKIFWTASGYQIDESKNPSKVEHFGIALVEAMSAGVVPLAYNAGGHREIIIENKNGFLWRKVSDLIRNTSYLVENKGILRNLSKESKVGSLKFSYEKFSEDFSKILL